jgi:hypothetical protein
MALYRIAATGTKLGSTENLGAGATRTVELLVALKDTRGVGLMASLLVGSGLLVDVACIGVNGLSYDSSWYNLRRTKVVVKVRRATARGAMRLAAAKAERWTNMARAIGVERRGCGGAVELQRFRWLSSELNHAMRALGLAQ